MNRQGVAVLDMRLRIPHSRGQLFSRSPTHPCGGGTHPCHEHGDRAKAMDDRSSKYQHDGSDDRDRQEDNRGVHDQDVRRKPENRVERRRHAPQPTPMRYLLGERRTTLVF